jgi:hypothetical protein
MMNATSDQLYQIDQRAREIQRAEQERQQAILAPQQELAQLQQQRAALLHQQRTERFLALVQANSEACQRVREVNNDLLYTIADGAVSAALKKYGEARLAWNDHRRAWRRAMDSINADVSASVMDATQDIKQGFLVGFAVNQAVYPYEAQLEKTMNADYALLAWIAAATTSDRQVRQGLAYCLIGQTALAFQLPPGYSAQQHYEGDAKSCGWYWATV